MATAKVYPLELREPWRELIYNMYERARESFGAALAVTVDMEAFDVLGEVGGRRQVTGQYTKTGSWGAGIVEFCFDLAVFGVDAQSERPAPFPSLHGRTLQRVRTILQAEGLPSLTGGVGGESEPLVLREGVEGDVRRAAENGGEITLGVSGRVSVGRGTKLFKSQSCFVGAGGRSVLNILAENGEGLPKGKRLEGENNLGTLTISHILDKSEVAAQ